jgi:orotidine-5'-phosphate decarboxylase
MNRKSGIILALDMDDPNLAVDICMVTADYIDAVKVGYPLVLSAGMDVLGRLKDMGKPVIADFKVADIPYISRLICERAVDEGADYVIVQGFLGEDVVEACAEVAQIFVVADMTHPGAGEFIHERARDIAQMARKHAYGLVLPANNPDEIERFRKIVGAMVIISPGVKAQGASPGSAIAAGADFEIVGRGIYEAEDPRKAAEEIYVAIKQVSPL